MHNQLASLKKSFYTIKTLTSLLTALWTEGERLDSNNPVTANRSWDEIYWVNIIIYKPADLGGDTSIAFCLCRVEGKSFNLSDRVRLNGEEASCNLENPRKDPCLTRRFWDAWGRCTANGLSTLFTGTGSVPKDGSNISM